MSIIKLKNVSKFYYNKKNISSGFNKLNLDLDMGEFVVITGESGSGKSTLLNVISGLDSYQEGEMYINGEETSHYTEIDYENYRRKYIGNIFQNFNLVNSYTVYENIELVLLLNGYKKKEIKAKVLEVIKTVGLVRYKNTKVSKLSGGQKQRVAIARALAKDTPIIVADEPTGNIDVKSANSIMKLLSEISNKKLVVIVTHNYEQVSDYATRKITMNDGKIIEDKKIKKHQEVKAELVKYKDLTVLNRLLLGLKNAFNIKAKFILLFLVYFFLTMLVFSEYSSLSKMEYDSKEIGINHFFLNDDANRVILTKKNKTSFTEKEKTDIMKLDNIETVDFNDLLLDLNISLYDNEMYFYGNVKSIKELDSVMNGNMPLNDNEVVVEGPKYSYYFEAYKDSIIGRTMSLQNNNNGLTLSKVSISGYNVYETDDIFANEEFTIYVSDTILNEVKIGLMDSYSNIEMTLNENVYDRYNSNIYFQIKSNDMVKDGEAYVFNDLNMNCKDYNCQNKKIKLKVSNIYFDDNKEFTIKKVLNKDNFKGSTGLANFDDYSNTIFISKNDYFNLYNKGEYQISVFLKDNKQSDETLEYLNNLGYETFFMKNNLVNYSEQIQGLVKMFRTIVFIIATIALFFISYIIIKIILKSRNIYFSTIRILGATKKVSKSLLNIELFIDINIAYLFFVVLVVLTKSNLINIKYIQDMITFFTLKDYVVVYLILILMSFLIANRYAKKLFEDTVMNTYREEV